MLRWTPPPGDEKPTAHERGLPPTLKRRWWQTEKPLDGQLLPSARGGGGGAQHRQERESSPPIFTVKSSATMQFLAARSRWTNLLAFR